MIYPDASHAMHRLRPTPQPQCPIAEFRDPDVTTGAIQANEVDHAAR